MKFYQNKRFTEIPYIYIIIIVGIVACIAIGFFWKVTAHIFGAERSVALLAATFSLALLDCSSSLIFADYMKRFQPQYLNAMFFGESFTATIPTILALIQGVGAYPLACVVSLKYPILKIKWIIFGTLVSFIACIFILHIASKSPCPMLSDTMQGGMLLTFVWFLSSFSGGYARVVSGNIIKRSWKKTSGLFWFGVTAQSGVCFGAIPMYVVINTFKLLEDRRPCEKYCL
ncbi:unnamed protein product [Didymodactylos carnosus]|uniref:Riboflavin transporter n=1 Tax=Didymodactylos carnosus TaxID=1234261 RepID=A0A813V2U0_9BILA|nr:unnamed protein product [Didymodactylos carnosus]CAF0888854.1 unnamed protein product [Didymodactylos carnosus]CAF3621465.1 unnamed protein product [Didymodactylos carnosus]CAF3671421.1 unnamed protein product [Didymodactylos carnosus]